MNAPVSSSHYQCHHSRTQHGYEVSGMSTGKFSEKSDVLTYRQHFALVWRDFIKANFESPAHVAFVFKVDPTTSEKWWSGSHAPQGWVVGMAMADPAMREETIKTLAGQG